jgi:hypothetical protein
MSDCPSELGTAAIDIDFIDRDLRADLALQVESGLLTQDQADEMALKMEGWK